MGGEPDINSEPKDGLKRKVDQRSIELAKQKAQELAARLNNDAETKRARFDTHSASPVHPAGAFSQPSFYDNSLKYQSQPSSYSSYGSTPTSKKISIPNDKVGVIIGKGGDTIKSLQLQSGARIQITKDAEANPNMGTRDVDLVGTTDQVSKAEELIHSVIAEADTNGSAAGARLGPTGGEQFVMKVPDNRVALLIGKGGETIKTIQNRSGARLQIVPLRPPPNEILTERSVFINGTQEQIDSAQEMVNEIVREGRLRVPPGPSSYMQPAYTSPASWVPPAQAPNQQYQTGYEYSAPGAYPPAPPYYGGYGTNPQAGWDQSNPQSVPPSQHSTGYSFYGQADQTSSGPPAYNYCYGQPLAPVPSQSGNQGYPPQPASYGQSFPGQQNTYSTTPGYGQPPTNELGAAQAQPTKTAPVNPVEYSQGTVTPASYGATQSYAAAPNSLPTYGTPQSYTALPTSQPAYGTSYPVASQPAYGTSQTTYGAQQGYLASPAPQCMYGAQQGYSVPPTSQHGYGLQHQGYTVPLTNDQAGYGGQPSSFPHPPLTALPPPASSITAQPPYGQSGGLAQPVPGSSIYPPPAYGQSQAKPPTQHQPPAGKPNGDEIASHGKNPSPAVETTPHSSSRAA